MEKSGAPLWAARVRKQPAETDHDPVLPSDWREAWEWRCATALLDSIDVHHELRNLFEQRHIQTTTLARAYQQLVAEKCWLNVFNNSPDSVQQDLQEVPECNSGHGYGVGLRAMRYRRVRARGNDARLSRRTMLGPAGGREQTIPSEIGLFDLVIIDEALSRTSGPSPFFCAGKSS